METLVFASNNAHKLEEIRAILGEKFKIKSLKDISCDADIPETGNTFQENALQKAQYVKAHYGLDCFADDSGLEVEALNWEPGIYSARYAQMNGLEVTSENKDDLNMDVLIDKLLALHPDKGEIAGAKVLSSARFHTAIALLYHGEIHYFDGIIPGFIINEKRGNEGFGYDPIFIPEGQQLTFSQLGTDIKNGMSHRARAVSQLAQFLKL